jgi:LysR family hydrogen peroxide-inducible transcriptional activator
MVAAGVGITLLPELAGRGAYGAARGVIIKPFVKPVPTRTIGAVWRKSSARREAILALAKQIEANAL